MSTEPDWTRLLQWDQPLQNRTPADLDEPADLAPRHSFPPATLVAGACGGSGATLTALGLANALALSSKRVVVVDAAPGGGDLVDRGATTVSPEDGVERLLADLCTGVSVSPTLFAECSSETSVGATILHQTGDHLDDPDMQPLDDFLRAQERPTVYDVGRMWRPAHARPLWWLPDDAPIVLTVPSRADAFNRMRYTLELLSSFRGVNRLGATLVVVSHQRPGVRLDDVAVLRNYLRGRVAGVHVVPYDEELALGAVVDHPSMRPETIAAYDELATTIADLAHRSAVRRAAQVENHQS